MIKNQQIGHLTVKRLFLYLDNDASVSDSIRSPGYDPVADVDVHSLMLASSIHSSRRFLPRALFSVHFSSELFFLLFKSASSRICRQFHRSRRWACSSRRAFRKCSRMAWARRANLSEEAAYYCQARAPGPPPELDPTTTKMTFPRKFATYQQIPKYSPNIKSKIQALFPVHFNPSTNENFEPRSTNLRETTGPVVPDLKIGIKPLLFP